MKKVFVFCIGGTGIRVMKSITMLMAGGMSTNGYTVVPIVLDPHLDLQEKTKLDSLIRKYKEIYNKIWSELSDTDKKIICELAKQIGRASCRERV